MAMEFEKDAKHITQEGGRKSFNVLTERGQELFA
jgi:hypothetical protein